MSRRRVSRGRGKARRSRVDSADGMPATVRRAPRVPARSLRIRSAPPPFRHRRRGPRVASQPRSWTSAPPRGTGVQDREAGRDGQVGRRRGGAAGRGGRPADRLAGVPELVRARSARAGHAPCRPPCGRPSDSVAALDARRGIVRLHPDVLTALALNPGDPVRLTGRRETAGIVALAEAGASRALLYADDLLLGNLGIRDGGQVTVAPAPT